MYTDDEELEYFPLFWEYQLVICVNKLTKRINYFVTYSMNTGIIECASILH